jgi:hypothetical protein
MENTSRFSAFVGEQCLVSGNLETLLQATHARLAVEPQAAVLIFDEGTGKQVDFDFRGTVAEVIARATPAARTGPGRPKLGVVSREVSLLPRHWEWLEGQPSGLSASLRRLVEEAIKREGPAGRQRQAREAVSRLMTALGGNRPHYEEATRALFAGDQARFESLLASWPTDVRSLLLRRLEG